MRILKFRAWDVFNADMFPEKVEDESLVKFFSDVNKRRDGGNCVYVMQFTGLCDSDGIEIYEGDVVQCSLSFEGGSIPHSGIVVYNDTFGAFATRNQAGETLIHNHLLNTFKVVGNVFENKELLAVADTDLFDIFGKQD
jgi:uncharacterized phage protein (TIGR01671 family)